MGGPNLSYPVAPPPPGVHSNYDNPPNHAALAYSTNIVSLVLITFFVWSRFAVKLCIVKSMHLEDYIIPFAWFFGVLHNVCAFLGYGIAPLIHSWDMPLSVSERYMLYGMIGACFYNISIALIKLAMLVQVLRIFVPAGSYSKSYYVIHTIIWTTIPFHFVIAFLMIFNCRPLKKAWVPWTPGKCLDTGAIAMSVACMNLVSDISILVISQKVIWSMMRMDIQQRRRLTIVFSIGIVPIAFAILCLIYNARMMHSSDIIYDVAIMALACHGEITSGLFVLWLPIIPRLFTYIKDRNHTRSLSKTSRSWPSSHKRELNKLEFSDRGVAGISGMDASSKRESGSENSFYEDLEKEAGGKLGKIQGAP